MFEIFSHNFGTMECENVNNENPNFEKKEVLKMKTVLCFGDSNTYGLKPDGSGRYDFIVRYPGKLQSLLGNEFQVIEEGCPGRTTVYEDINRPFKKGIDYIVPCLHSHSPLDYVVVMLGTNDCKLAYNATSKDIAHGLSQIISQVRSITPSSQFIIISPIHLGDAVWEYDFEFNKKSVEVSKGLCREYKLLALETDSLFLDASGVAVASSIDEEHLDEIGHSEVANAVAEIIKNI